MGAISSFHSSMLAFSDAKVSDSFTKENGALSRLSHPHPILAWLPCFQDNRPPLTKEELAKEIIALFSKTHNLTADEVAGVAFCRKTLRTMLPQQHEILERMEQMLSRSSPLFAVPIEVMLTFGSVATLRSLSSTLHKRLSTSALFTQWKILEKAIQGEPFAVRKLAAYLAFLQPEDARSLFERFYESAKPKAKEQFWRSLFCNGHWPHFATLLTEPLDKVTDFSLKLETTQSLYEGVITLLSHCPNLTSLTIKHGQIKGQEKAFVNMLMKCQQLQRLSLKISECNYEEFYKLSGHPALQSLTIDSIESPNLSTFLNEHLPRGLKELLLDFDYLEKLPVPNLTYLPELRKIQLNGFVFGITESNSLGEFQNLRSFYANELIGPLPLQRLCQHRGLQELSLYCKLISYDFLLGRLIELKELTSVSLFVDQGELMNVSFLTALVTNCPNIRSISLHNTLTGTEEEMAALANALAKAPQIEHLLLRPLQTPSTFAKAILQLPNLRSLALDIMDDEILTKALIECAPTSVLEQLSLFQRREISADFFSAVSTLSKLRSLRIQGTIADSAVAQLTTNASNITFTLTTTHHAFTAKGLSSILQLPTVRKCTIQGRATIKATEALAAVEKATHLQSFELWKTGPGQHVDSIQLTSKKLAHLHTLYLNTEKPILGAPLDQLRWSVTAPTILGKKLA